MDVRIEVRDITIERDRGMTVVFGDGRECAFGLEELRVNCPCAACRGAREQGEAPWPGPSSPRPLTVRDAQLVGAWGLGITWNDGHATGIYPWEALRRWCEADHPVFTPDSGLGA
jgi:ATP-binding protein involved in chromosome partitioning